MTPNEKYSCLSPEEMVTNRKYTFTFNPSNDGQYFNAENRIDLVKKQMETLLVRLSAEITVRMEVSKMGRLHWHGTIKFPYDKNIADFFILQIHMLQSKGTYEIDNIAKPSDWQEYCNKQTLIQPPVILKTPDAWIKRLKKIDTKPTVRMLKIPLQPESESDDDSECDSCLWKGD